MNTKTAMHTKKYTRIPSIWNITKFSLCNESLEYNLYIKAYKETHKCDPNSENTIEIMPR